MLRSDLDVTFDGRLLGGDVVHVDTQWVRRRDLRVGISLALVPLLREIRRPRLALAAADEAREEGAGQAAGAVGSCAAAVAEERRKLRAESQSRARRAEANEGSSGAASKRQKQKTHPKQKQKLKKKGNTKQKKAAGL